MKKCFYFPTWEEREDVMISLDGSYIQLIDEIISCVDALMSSPENGCCEDILSYKYNKTTSSDPILAKLCELTGAKWYGEYVVIDCFFHKARFLQHCSGDISKCVATYSVLSNKNTKMICVAAKDDNISGHFGFYTFHNGKIDYVGPCGRFEEIITLYNIFEQYSLFLQGKENKWEEVKDVLCV